MITQLRDRNRADRFLNDVRANQRKRRNWGRWVYLTAVLAVFLYVANLFVGPFLWLQAEGLVNSDYVIIASPYDVQVDEIVAKPGQRVKKGEVLAVTHSPKVTEAMAALTQRAAETTARQAELTVKLDVANTVIKTAEDRLAQSEQQLKKVNAARASTGFISDAFIAGVEKDRYAAMQELALRGAERTSAISQLALLKEAQDDAKAALQQMRTAYNEGVVLAPADGIVGAQLRVQGDVVRPGDYLMQVYFGPKYALVYLETGTLHAAAVGDRVEVADGFKHTTGAISEVLPLTVPLPLEFQKAFRPPSRGQVAKIALDQQATFPMFSRIAVTGDKLIPGNDTITRSRLSRMAAEAARGLVQHGYASAHMIVRYARAQIVRVFGEPGPEFDRSASAGDLRHSHNAVAKPRASRSDQAEVGVPQA